MPDDRKTTNEPPIAPGLARDDEAAEERGIDTERQADDASPHRDEAIVAPTRPGARASARYRPRRRSSADPPRRTGTHRR